MANRGAHQIETEEAAVASRNRTGNQRVHPSRRIDRSNRKDSRKVSRNGVGNSSRSAAGNNRSGVGNSNRNGAGNSPPEDRSNP
jgi:hypothetical protein